MKLKEILSIVENEFAVPVNLADWVNCLPVNQRGVKKVASSSVVLESVTFL